MSRCGWLGLKETAIIIHAAGPEWKGGRWKEAEDLKKVVEGCLIEANKHNCKSIVIPAISTGIFNYDMDKASEIISTTVINYDYTNNNDLRDIIFIDTDKEKVEKWGKRFETNMCW